MSQTPSSAQQLSSQPFAITKTHAVALFLVFALSYFISAALRTVIGTYAPLLTQEFSLEARDLGLLAGAYFLGFASCQIPFGFALDRLGPKKVLVSLLCVAMLGCLLFSYVTQFGWLLLARFLIGVGVSVCLMAPLTAYRRWYAKETQLRANSWMLMTGSLGMLCATLPAQAALQVTSWRGVFVGFAALIVIVCALLLLVIPRWEAQNKVVTGAESTLSTWEIFKHPFFWRMTPICFVFYGGMIATQTLWVAPWMTQVARYSAARAAEGLFWLNLAMLVTYWMWGIFNPKLSAKGFDAVRLIKLGMPLSLVLLPLAIWIAQDGLLPIWAWWTLFIMSCSFISLAQPAVGMAFPSHMAGRALTAYNLVIFLGIFVMQWGIGLAIDGFVWLGYQKPEAFVAAYIVYWCLSLFAYAHFVFAKDNETSAKV